MPTTKMTQAVDYAIDAVIKEGDSPKGGPKGSKGWLDWDPYWDIMTDCWGVVQDYLDSRPEVKAQAASSKAPRSTPGDTDFSSPDYWKAVAVGLTAPIYGARQRTKSGPIPREIAQDPKFAVLKASVLSVVLPPVVAALAGEPFNPDAVGVPEAPAGASKGWLSDAWDYATDWAEDHIDEAIDYAWNYLNK